MLESILQKRKEAAALHWKRFLWPLCYTLALVGFTVYVLLDTFVIVRAYTTVPAAPTTQMAPVEEAAQTGAPGQAALLRYFHVPHRLAEDSPSRRVCARVDGAVCEEDQVNTIPPAFHLTESGRSYYAFLRRFNAYHFSDSLNGIKTILDAS